MPMVNWLPRPETMIFIPRISNDLLSFEPPISNGERVSYLVDSDLNLHIGIGRYYMGLKAGAIIMAGEIKCHDGKISYINNRSEPFEPGYYEFINFVKEFRRLPFVSKNLKIEFHDFKKKASRKTILELKNDDKWKSNTNKKSQGVNENWFIFLHNDSVNDMIDIVVALGNNTGLSYEDCVRIMNCAHYHETALIGHGPYPYLEDLQRRLQNDGLTISLELVADISSSN
jgi:ATP-dependent Clp protease adapter protein ClpS